MASRAVEETGKQGREHRRGQAIGWDQGRWAAGVARVETKKKKKKKRDDGQRVCLGRGFIPVAPAGAQQRDLDVNQADNMTAPPKRAPGRLPKA